MIGGSVLTDRLAEGCRWNAGTAPADAKQFAGNPFGLLAVLAVAFLTLLPFASGNLMAATFGDLSMNLALPFFLLLAPPVVLRALPFPVRADVGGRYEALVRVVFWFFVWCALTTLVTGLLFEAKGLEAYGARPLKHSLMRFPVPLILGLLVVVSYQIGLRILSTRHIDRVLCASAFALALYGAMQLYAMHGSHSWYFSLIKWIEAGRNRPGPWQPDILSYIHLTGRLNLTTFEAAEAARLLLIVYIPVLATPERGRLGFSRILLLVFLIGLILAAQTIVGLAGLCVLGAFCLFAFRGRLRVFFAAVAVVVALAVMLTMPNRFSERLTGLATNNDVTEMDQSALTRAAFAVASLRVAIEQPILGIGWSKDIFFLADAMPTWGYSWEVSHSLATGEAVAAKSLVVRLFLYGGVPAFALLAIFYVRTVREALRQYRATHNPLHRRLFLVLLMFAVGGTLDGGILTGCYSWAALGMALGVASRTVVTHGKNERCL